MIQKYNVITDQASTPFWKGLNQFQTRKNLMANLNNDVESVYA